MTRRIKHALPITGEPFLSRVSQRMEAIMIALLIFAVLVALIAWVEKTTWFDADWQETLSHEVPDLNRV